MSETEQTRKISLQQVLLDKACAIVKTVYECLLGFWRGCADLTSYDDIGAVSFRRLLAQALLAILALSVCWSWRVARESQLRLQNMLSAVPVVLLERGEALYEVGFEPPFVLALPGVESRRFRYILDYGDNMDRLETKYDSFVMFKQFSLVLRFGEWREELTYADLERMPLLSIFFGQPMQFDSQTVASFVAAVVGLSLLLLPIPSLAILVLISNCLLVLLVLKAVKKVGSSMAEVVKICLLAACPALMMMMLSPFVVGVQSCLNVIAASLLIHLLYAIIGLKSYERLLHR